MIKCRPGDDDDDVDGDAQEWNGGWTDVRVEKWCSIDSD